MSPSPRCQQDLWMNSELTRLNDEARACKSSSGVCEAEQKGCCKDDKRAYVPVICSMPHISLPQNQSKCPFPPAAPHNTTSYLMNLYSCSSSTTLSEKRHQRYAPKVKRRFDEVDVSFLDDNLECLDTFGSFISNTSSRSDDSTVDTNRSPKRRRFVNDIVRTAVSDASDELL